MTSGRGSRIPSRVVGWGVTLLSCAVFLALCWRVRTFVTDDAWISVRYAENLADGHGFVWNPGGARAEGFSNPLLVYLEAAAKLLGWSALSAARVLGVLSGLGCIVLVHRRGREVVGEVAARTAAVLTACSPPFALWAVAGLETTTTALVLTGASVELARPGGGRARLSGALLALLPWLRPEGIVVAVPLALLSEGPALLRRGTRRTALRRLAWVGGLPVLSQVALEALRLGVYGHLVPNSVISKSGTGGLLDVAAGFVEQSAPVLVLAAAGTLLATGRRWLLAVGPVVYLVGSLGTLDVVNAFSRFLLPTWPLLTLLTGMAVSAFFAAAPVWRGGLAAGAAVAACAVMAVRVLPGNLVVVSRFDDSYMSCRAVARADAARWLRTSTPAGTVYSVSDAGLVPARAGRTAIDQFMLNEPAIQRTGPLSPAAAGAFVLDRRPDLVVLASATAARLEPSYATDRSMYADPRMRSYHVVHVAAGRTPRSCSYALFVLSR